MTAVLAVLFGTLWQGAAIALTAWGASRAMRNANATTRCALWTCALILCVAVPIAAAFAPAAMQQYRAAAPPPVAGPAHRNSQAVITAHPAARATLPASVPALNARPRLELPPAVLLAIVALWALGALYGVIRLAWGVVSLARLKRDAMPLHPAYRVGLKRWYAQYDGRPSVRICVSNVIAVPVAVGLFDAMILLPETLPQQLSAAELDGILLHEYAHLRRRDAWVHLFERLVCALCFFNPFIRYIAAHVDLEREISCDDLALGESDQRQTVSYAGCLAKMAQTVAWPYAAPAAPGVFNTRRNLSQRIERLLLAARDRRARLATVPVLAAAGGMLMLGTAAAAMAPALAVVSVRHVAMVRRQVATPAPLPTVAPVPTITPISAPSATPSPTPSPTPSLTPVAMTRPVTVARATTPAPRPSPRPTAERAGGYLDALAAAGYSGLSVDELTELRAMNIDGAYITSMERAGLTHPSPKDLVLLRASGVSPQDVSSMRGRYPGLAIHDIADMSLMHVTPEYAAGMAAAGYPGLTPHQLIELRALGIDGAFIRAAAAHGWTHLTVDQLERLKASGLL